MPRAPTTQLRATLSKSAHSDLRKTTGAFRTCEPRIPKNELRWLDNYVKKVKQLKQTQPQRYPRQAPSLAELCNQRAKGRPLQYILGSQPFGDLEILCRKNVLIPRPETEVYTMRLASLIQKHANKQDRLHVLDICAGSGCIGLGLLSVLNQQQPHVEVTAVDINTRARKVALDTIRLNQKLGRLAHELPYRYISADILNISDTAQAIGSDQVDVLISNPPYISIPAFARDTAKSVKNYEPKNALVPFPIPPGLKGEGTGDVFYSPILDIAQQKHVRLVLMEVADIEQARRVMEIVAEREKQSNVIWSTKQIWCDDIDIYGHDRPVHSAGVSVVGAGNGRTVVLARDWASGVISEAI